MNVMELWNNAAALGVLTVLLAGLLSLKRYLKGYLRMGNG